MQIKLTSTLVLIGMVLCLSVGLFFSIKKTQQIKRDAIRWEKNYTIAKDSISVVNMTLSEFKKHSDKKVDSLLTKLNIKPKQVEKIIYVDNTIVIKDTIKVLLKQEENKDKYSFLQYIDCIEVAGFIESPSEPSLNITSVSCEVETSYIAYKERKKKTILGFIHTRLFSKKETVLEVTPSCGDVKLVEINIIKRK